MFYTDEKIIALIYQMVTDHSYAYLINTLAGHPADVFFLKGSKERRRFLGKFVQIFTEPSYNNNNHVFSILKLIELLRTDLDLPWSVVGRRLYTSLGDSSR